MASQAGARYALAIFGDWPGLLLAVAALADEFDASHALSLVSLSVLFDEPALQSGVKSLEPALQHAIEKRVSLTFGAPNFLVSCTAGGLAEQLARRAKQGSATFGDALRAWMVNKQAARIDDDVRHGRMLLWARLLLPGQEQSTCETLLNAHPLRVEVHDLVPVSVPIVNPKVPSP